VFIEPGRVTRRAIVSADSLTRLFAPLDHMRFDALLPAADDDALAFPDDPTVAVRHQSNFRIPLRPTQSRHARIAL
jgi:hypothetical protein